MRGRLGAALAAAAAVASAGLAPAAAQDEPSGWTHGDVAGDAVVVAVIDDALGPYHWDFAAEHMPVRLPLDQPPHTWLPGFPDPSTFGLYEPLPLTLAPHDADAVVADLAAADAETWSRVQRSGRADQSYYWVPGTKVIGLLDFAGNRVRGSNGSHGTRSAAVATGALNGTCPECLLVFLSFSDVASAEAAIEWAMAQPWIDAITNSYGFSRTSQYRDRIYSGSDTEAQRRASERGQTIFFSAGNGLENDFRVPNTTYLSSQEGPDWIVTVGAATPAGDAYSGSGKPADLSAPGFGYPSPGGTTVSGSGVFGGTSNATPVTAGLYAHALAHARGRLDGASRVQAGGVIATGDAPACGPAVADCDLADGALTAGELRRRLLEGAIPRAARAEVGSTEQVGTLRVPLASAESRFAAEGHGTYLARLAADAERAAELAGLLGPLDGSAAPPPRPDGEHEWFTVDSFCRQHLWGSWSGGYWHPGSPLPPPDAAWPGRTVLAAGCPVLPPQR